jgi:hypothetical protein
MFASPPLFLSGPRENRLAERLRIDESEADSDRLIYPLETRC